MLWPMRPASHRRSGVVPILAAGKTAEYGLAGQAGRKAAGVLTPAALRNDAARQIGKPEGVVQFAIRRQSGVGSGAADVELQFQPAASRPEAIPRPFRPLGVP